MPVVMQSDSPGSEVPLRELNVLQTSHPWGSSKLSVTTAADVSDGHVSTIDLHGRAQTIIPEHVSTSPSIHCQCVAGRASRRGLKFLSRVQRLWKRSQRSTALCCSLFPSVFTLTSLCLDFPGDSPPPPLFISLTILFTQPALLFPL